MTGAGVAAGLLAALLYAVAGARCIRTLRAGNQTVPASQQRLPLALALVCHAASLTLNQTFDFALVDALSLTAWLMVATLLALAFSLPVLSLGSVVAPIAAVIVGLTPLFDTRARPSVDSGVWVHAVLSLSAYGLLGLAALQA